jgi:hypothetical protein
MIPRALAKIIPTAFIAGAIALLYLFTPAAPAQMSGTSDAQMQDAQAPQLDFEFFKTRVEPIFLKKRSDEHARCYVCHQMAHHGGGPLSLEMLSPGSTFWTEEQSRKNFETVSKLVVPGEPSRSWLWKQAAAPILIRAAGNSHPRTIPTGRT